MAYAEQDLMDRLRASNMDNMLESVSMDDGDGKLRAPNAKKLYFGLLNASPTKPTLAQSRRFLIQQLESVPAAEVDLPTHRNELACWMRANTAAVGAQYRQYLDERKAGGPRRYFPGKSHALHFLNAVAPTKLVDGAWLYGLTSLWRDARYCELIRIYLEELGEGDPKKTTC